MSQDEGRVIGLPPMPDPTRLPSEDEHAAFHRRSNLSMPSSLCTRCTVQSTELDEATVRRWLLAYAWMGSVSEQEAEVNCIMAQGQWRNISAVADRYAGAQEVPGEGPFAEGVEFALSSLYECHDVPHQDTCPMALTVADLPMGGCSTASAHQAHLATGDTRCENEVGQ